MPMLIGMAVLILLIAVVVRLLPKSIHVCMKYRGNIG